MVLRLQYLADEKEEISELLSASVGGCLVISSSLTTNLLAISDPLLDAYVTTGNKIPCLSQESSIVSLITK